MKRILTALLCVFTIISTVGSPAFGVGEIKFSQDYEKAVSVLSYIGIVGDYDTENGGNASDDVTRAKFAEMTAKLLKLDNTSNVTYYSDVKPDHRGYGYINSLVERSIISLSDDNLFNPDDNITYEQAIKIAVRAMGYGVYAEGSGGYPYGYIKIANKLKLTSGVDITKEFKYSDAVALLYKAASEKMCDINAITADGNIDYAQSDDTVLSAYWELYQGEGRVKGYFGGSMDGGVVKDGEVKIDNTLYDLSDGINPKPYFTNIVEFLYKKNGNDKGTVIYLENSKSENKGAVIDSEQYSAFNGDTNTISYYKNNSDSLTSVNLPRNVRVVFNGMPYTGSVEKLFAEYFDNNSHRGTIYVNDTDDGTKNLLVIEAYRTFVVSHLDGNDIIYNKYNSADYIETNKCDYLRVYDENGKILEKNFAEGNVYMAAVSKDKKNVSLIYYRVPTLKGTVSTVIRDNKIIIDGTEYKVDNGLVKYSSLPKPGTVCDIYTDSFGYVTAMKEEKNTNNLRLAYLIDFSCEEDAFSYRFKFKVLDQDGKIVILESNDNIIVDGVKRDNAELAKNLSNYFPEVKVKDNRAVLGQQVIRYRADENNIIKEIDTALTSDAEKEKEGYNLSKYPDNVYENVLTGVEKNKKQLVNVSQGGIAICRLDSNIMFKRDASTTMFNVPLTDSEGYLMHEESYVKKEGTYLTDQEYIYDANGNKIKADDSMYYTGMTTLTGTICYFMDAYDYDKDSPYAETIVYHYPVAERNSSVQMVTGFSEDMDENGDISSMIKLKSGAAEKAYVIDDYGLLTKMDANGNPIKINKGDIVIADLDIKSNKIYNLTKLYDMKENKILPNPSKHYTAYENWGSGGYSSTYTRFLVSGQLSKGKVLKRVGTVLFIDWNDDFVYDEIAETNGAGIIVFDSSEVRQDREFRNGSIADINDFESAGENCSEVLCATNYGSVVNVFVYK